MFAKMHLDEDMVFNGAIPKDAEAVIGGWWSGWAFPTSGKRWALIWRGQGDSGATLVELGTLDQLNQYCDGLEGDTDEFVRN